MVACCAVIAGCRPRPVEPRPLAVVVSGDTAGWIVPCGCTSNQSGGLPRRASYIETIRESQEVIAVDVGGAPAGKSAYDLVKFEAILRGETAMGIAAHNIGAAETALGAERLAEVAERVGAPLLSANVRRADGEPIARPLVIVEAAGRRVALVGVLSPRYAGGDLQVTSPRQAVLDALREAKGRYDSAIVLAYLPDDELRQLAESLPEADAVVGGPTVQPIQPKLFGPTLLASATRQGKFLARLDAPAGAGPWTGEIVELTDRWADDPGQVGNLAWFREELARRDFSPAETSLAAPLPPGLPAGFSIAGNAKCRKCHEDDCRTWGRSAHAHAWESLTEKGNHVDPDCQRCHTTGYGLPGGFVSVKRSPAAVAVGCESCHGPSRGHCDEPKVPTARFAAARNLCTSCHDRENSPKFAYDEYWEKIRHGEKARE